MKQLSKITLCSALVAIGWFGVSPLFAQSADISGLMGKTSLTQAEKQAIEQWINSQLSSLSSALTKPISAEYTVPKQHRAVTGIVKTIVNTSKGSPAFKQAFLTSLGKQITANLDTVDIKVAIREAVLMVNLADVALVDSFSSLLDAKDPALKSLALEGLLTLTDKIPASKTNPLIDKIAKLISATNEEVLSQEGYQFLSKIDNQSARSALISALNVRAQQYTKGAAGNFDADRALVESIAKVSDKVNDATKKQIVSSLTDIFKVSVGLIVSKNIPLADVRGRVEMLIYSIEKTMSNLMGKNTNLPVTAALKQADLNKAKSALRLWVTKSK